MEYELQWLNTYNFVAPNSVGMTSKLPTTHQQAWCMCPQYFNTSQLYAISCFIKVDL